MANAAFANVDPRLLAENKVSGLTPVAAGLTQFLGQMAQGLQEANKANMARAKASQRSAETNYATDLNRRQRRKLGEQSLLNRPPDDEDSGEDDIYVDKKGNQVAAYEDEDGNMVAPEGATRVDFSGSEALAKPDFRKEYANPAERRLARKNWRKDKRAYLQGRQDDLVKEGEDGVQRVADEIKLNELSPGKRNRLLRTLGEGNGQEQLLLQAMKTVSEGTGLSKYSKNYGFMNAYTQNPRSLTRVIEQDGTITFKVMDANGDYHSVAADSLKTQTTKKNGVETTSVLGFSDKDDMKLIPQDLQDEIHERAKKYDGDQAQFKAFQELMSEDPKFALKAVEMLEDIIDPSKLEQYDTNGQPGLQPDEIVKMNSGDLWSFYEGYQTQLEKEGGIVGAEQFLTPFLEDFTTLRDLSPETLADRREITVLETNLSGRVGEPVEYLGNDLGSFSSKFEGHRNPNARYIKVGEGDNARVYDINTFDGQIEFSREGAEEANLDQTTIESLSPYLRNKEVVEEVVETKEEETEILNVFSQDGAGGTEGSTSGYEVGTITGDPQADIDLVNEWTARRDARIPSSGSQVIPSTGFQPGTQQYTSVGSELKPAYDFFMEHGYIPFDLVNPKSSPLERKGAYNLLNAGEVPEQGPLQGPLNENQTSLTTSSRGVQTPASEITPTTGQVDPNANSITGTNVQGVNVVQPIQTPGTVGTPGTPATGGHQAVATAINGVGIAQRLADNTIKALEGTEITNANYEAVKEIVWQNVKFGPARGEVMAALGYDSNGKLPTPDQAKILKQALKGANVLRNTLSGLSNFTEKGRELNNGGGLDPKFTPIANDTISAIAKQFPNLKFEITAGNDDFHHHLSYKSLHTEGQGLDFVLRGKYTQDDVNKVFEYLNSIKGDNLKVKNEYSNPSAKATAKHFHFELIS